MMNDPTRSFVSSFQPELELLQLVLQEPIAYPWNPTDADTEEYFTALEQEVLNAGWSIEELTEQGQVLASCLDQAWASLQPASDTVVDSLVSRMLSAGLFQQFASQVPQQIFKGIVERARQVMASSTSLSDQLVECAQVCLPTWATEDLQVLARPFAYAMRSGETEMLEVALRSVRSAAWTELSGVEQARLSLAIARYAISQLPAAEAQADAE